MTERRRRRGPKTKFTDEVLPPAPEEEIRTTPIRLTVDLAPPLHTEVKRWTNRAALHLDLTDVRLAQVARALLAELTEPDPERRLPGLEARVLARLKAGDYTHAVPTEVQ